MTGRSQAQRSLDAEARAVEEGHRAFVQPDGSVKVVSDTRPGKHYIVTFRALTAGERITFKCEPQGLGSYAGDHLLLSGPPGCTACKHAALAARRLEREGLADWSPSELDWFREGPWKATEKAAKLTARRLPPQPSNPFEGLPTG